MSQSVRIRSSWRIIIILLLLHWEGDHGKKDRLKWVVLVFAGTVVCHGEVSVTVGGEWRAVYTFDSNSEALQ